MFVTGCSGLRLSLCTFGVLIFAPDCKSSFPFRKMTRLYQSELYRQWKGNYELTTVTFPAVSSSTINFMGKCGLFLVYQQVGLQDL